MPPLHLNLLAEGQPVCELVRVAPPGSRRPRLSLDHTDVNEKCIGLHWPPHLSIKKKWALFIVEVDMHMDIKPNGNESQINHDERDCTDKSGGLSTQTSQ